MRVTMWKWMVEALKLDPNLHQDTIGKLTSRAFDWCNKNVVVPVLNYTFLISKVQNYYSLQFNCFEEKIEIFPSVLFLQYLSTGSMVFSKSTNDSPISTLRPVVTGPPFIPPFFYCQFLCILQKR